IEAKHLLHCFPNFVPEWKKYGDTPEIASLIAPRTLHLNFGEADNGSCRMFVIQTEITKFRQKLLRT
ncbi:MAG: hypothetical protein K9H65_02495, partial [Bacteroidales bacterium]|nr:hypothetical protein [Bacteroidales bacterium]